MDGELKYRDRVRIADGAGIVIGFYWHTDAALILLDTGDGLTVSVHELDVAA